MLMTFTKRATFAGMDQLGTSKRVVTDTFRLPMKSSSVINHRLSLYLLTVLLGLCTSFPAWPSEPITVSVESLQAVSSLSSQAIGLSFETSQMLPDKKGAHYFRPDNQELIAMFKTLGIESLRIGGNSVDTAGIPIPNESDIDSLFEFAKAAGVKVIYSVRLENGDSKSASEAAKRIYGRYPDLISCFAIGNEPS